MKLRWILAVVFVLAAAYFALFGGDYGYFEVRRLAQEQAREEARLRELRGEVAGLRARADSLEHDSATLERLAREKYGLIRDGERLYRFVDSAKAKPRDSIGTR
ncbi:MAG TPA: septum formation initiator family protein [Longimicrobiales bacterium]|nr:septum formation initiator family protein [Longimicrobiales bacterium]